ncbi:MAG: transporter substrate-binding protein [Caulobacteraceae bacterium]|nr:transporter substrate-binding protein [Caulobacteraceae bacterium]
MKGPLSALGAVLALAGPAQAAPRVASLDQCADQYVLALSPRASIVGLSYRSQGGDSYLAALAKGLPKRRDTLESLLTAQPQLVVRYWGGDARLTRSLSERGVEVLTLGEARDFAGIRANIRKVALAVGRPEAGEGLVRDMDRKLAAAGAAPTHRTVAYLTPGAATAGPGTLVDAILGAAGLDNQERRPGYRVLSLERLALSPPSQLVLGFFDAFALDRAWWSPAHGGAMRATMHRRTLASLPGAILGCPAWFAADGALSLSRAAAGT